MTIKRQLLNFGGRSVDFRVGAEALHDFSRVLRGTVGMPVRAFVISGATVEDDVLERVRREVIDAGFDLTVWRAPASDEAMTPASLTAALAAIAQAGITADDVIVGLGDVAATSLTCYAARLWCGGTPAVLVPTCLEGMVTAATEALPLAVPGCDMRVGCRPEPAMVFCDLSLLDGPADPAGTVPMLGAALADSRRSWERLKAQAPRLGKGDPATILDVLCIAQTARRAVVASANPSARHGLLYGVTTARALDAALRAQGREVPWWHLLAEGMRFEARLATEAGKLPVDEVFDQDDCLEDLGVAELAFTLDADSFIEAIERENARWANRLFFALPKAFGTIRLTKVDDEVLRRHAEAYLASRAELAG